MSIQDAVLIAFVVAIVTLGAAFATAAFMVSMKDKADKENHNHSEE